MLLSTLMSGVTPNPAFTGWSTNDDMVLAIDTDPTAVIPTAVTAYHVVQVGIEGLDAQLNPIMTEKNYIRAGQSSIKTGNQRTFKPAGDRYIGDEAQDYMLAFARSQGKGNDCITNYVYFNMLTGVGETGQVSIVVNSEGGGNAGESSAFDVDLKKVGAAPAVYSYVAGSYSAVALSTIVPADGAESIAVDASIVITFNNTIAENAIALFDTDTGDVVACTSAWDATKKIITITPNADLTASTLYLVSVAGVVDVYGQALATVGKNFTTAA